MKAPKPSYYEQRAAELLQARLKGCCEWKDVPGAPPGTYDFAIHLPADHRVAVEVTRVTNESLERVWARGDPRPASRLKKHWELLVDPVSWKHKNSDKVEHSLERLEKLGVEGFRTYVDNEQDLPEEARPAVERLRDLGVIAGRARPCSAKIEIFTAGTETADPREVPKRIAESEAHKEDNRKKLSKAKDVKERHLFVWVGPFARLDSAIWAAGEDVGKLQPASLPPEIDVVWVATEREGSGGRSELLLNQRRGGRWRKA